MLRLDLQVNKATQPAAIDRSSISQLFLDSLALSAWKEAAGSRWALRINPSSGNLHPTEGYLCCGPIAGLCASAGVYHYAPKEHALELRQQFSSQQWATLSQGLPPGSILIGLSSILWREAWKYGERAFRYCQHDVGHAIGAIMVAAANLGWQVDLLTSVGDADLAQLLAIDQQSGSEAEHPDCLLAVYPRGPKPWRGQQQYTLPRIDKRPVPGQPNQLSAEHHDWPIIDEVTDACGKPEGPLAQAKHQSSIRTGYPRSIIKQRRSAVAMDGKTSINRDDFYQMLEKLSCQLAWRPRIHLAIMVHRVDGLEPGLYFLCPSDKQGDFAAALRPGFRWDPAPNCPPDLALYCLEPGDARGLAQASSCQQEIAADGCFALAMLAEFEDSLQAMGPCFYRHLHWEAGLIGQILYLQAESLGIRATGIGCFFDDVVHEALGISDMKLQDLYHFTVGGPVEDTRLQSHPPY